MLRFSAKTLLTAYTTPGQAKKAASASARHDVRRTCQQESKDCS
jgi:hypothetical protein